MQVTTSQPTMATTVPIVPARPTVEYVLVVGHPDRYFEVFANSNIRVHFAQLPTTATVEVEILAEQYIECTMPRPYREVFCPGNRRLLERVEPIKPSDIARREYDLALFRGIQQSATEGAR